MKVIGKLVGLALAIILCYTGVAVAVAIVENSSFWLETLVGILIGSSISVFGYLLLALLLEDLE